jgi:hypothetical protein
MNYNYPQSDLPANLVCEPISSWGGSWTQEKLDAFEKYVNACASNNETALKIAKDIIYKKQGI